MALKSWLSTLKGDVSAVSPVQAPNPKGASRNVLETADVSGVSGSGNRGLDDTSDTARTRPAYQHQPARSSACTGDAAETSQNFDYEVQLVTKEAIEYSDRYCWPKSSAMNFEEINTFKVRLQWLEKLGLNIKQAEKLCDLILARDREGANSDMRSCFECRYLVITNGWFCKNWKMAKVAIRAKDAQLPTDFVVQLQRCNGFFRNSSF